MNKQFTDKFKIQAVKQVTKQGYKWQVCQSFLGSPPTASTT